MFGVFWSFLNPLVMLAVYTIVFGSIFKSRWGGTEENVAHFALVLFAGMIVFNIFSECVGRSPSLIINNSNYVKKVVFPLELLPWTVIGAATFHGAISLVVLLLFNLVVNHTIHWTVVLFPIVIFPLTVLIAGITLALSALGAYLRDIGQVIGLLMSILMFFCPLFYPVTVIPEKYRAFIYLNPLTFIIEQSRDVLLWGKMPNWTGLSVYLIGATVVACLGFVFFQRARKGFADVL